MVMYRTLGMFIFVDVCFFLFFNYFCFQISFFPATFGLLSLLPEALLPPPSQPERAKRRTIASTNHKLNIWQRPKVSQETFGFGQICLIWKTIPPQRIANKVSFVVPVAPPPVCRTKGTVVFFFLFVCLGHDMLVSGFWRRICALYW